MMIQFERMHLNFECANFECDNTSSEGNFIRVTIGHSEIVGGFRPLILHMCAPCADAMKGEVFR